MTNQQSLDKIFCSTKYALKLIEMTIACSPVTQSQIQNSELFEYCLANTVENPSQKYYIGHFY